MLIRSGFSLIEKRKFSPQRAMIVEKSILLGYSPEEKAFKATVTNNSYNI